MYGFHVIQQNEATHTLAAEARAASRGSSDRVGLVIRFLSTGRGFAPRFFQTPPRDDALALR